MILEGVCTTCNADHSVNVAPMGPIVDDKMTSLIFRPYATSTTFQNLRDQKVGVFHVTDNVDLIARAAVGSLSPTPKMFPAATIDGAILADACRWYEFEVRHIDDSEERAVIRVEVVYKGRIRDFFGLNRAKHAVLEAAILATRIHLLPADDIRRQLDQLALIVHKTAGPQERSAFQFLEEHFRAHLPGGLP